MGDIKGTAHSINAVIAHTCLMAVLYGHKALKMAAIKHADAELECFIALNKLEELLWLPENTLGHYWMGANDHW